MSSLPNAREKIEEGELSWFNYHTEAKLKEGKRKRTREVCHEGTVTVDANFIQSKSTIYLKYDYVLSTIKIKK